MKFDHRILWTGLRRIRWALILKRWAFLWVPAISLTMSLTLPRPIYFYCLLAFTGGIIGWIVAEWQRPILPRRIHPDMLPMDGPEKYLIAKAYNERRAVYGQVDEDGKLTMFNSEELMSQQAHPHFHAVKFVTRLAEIMFGQNRMPTPIEIEMAYRQSLRCDATVHTDIGLGELIENFGVVMAEIRRLNYEGSVRDGLVSFACEISSRLDERVKA